MAKLKIDYNKIQEILLNKESARLNCIYMLMDFKPYRKSIFLQILGKGNKFNKVWQDLEYKDKMLWIQDNMFHKWSTEEFVEHILQAIVMFENNDIIVKSIILALEVDLMEIKNV